MLTSTYCCIDLSYLCTRKSLLGTMKYKKGIIRLEGLKFYARHGVLPQETQIGAWFTLDLCLEVGLAKAAESDNLEDTLNYALVYSVVKEEMYKPSRLLEAAAGRIAGALFDRFASIEALTVRLMKDNPPIGCECSGFGVELHYER